MVDAVLLKADVALDALAIIVRKLLSLCEVNASGLSQERYGVNRGGNYYLFETLGLEVLLMANAGESQLCDDVKWEHHLTIDVGTPGLTYDRVLVDKLLRHIASVLTIHGMNVRLLESAF